MANHKKNAGFLLPTTDEYDNFCITFVVPNEQNHKAAFFGALKKLSDWYNWEQDGTHAAADAANIWKAILANPAYSMECNGMIEDIRVEGCIIEKKVGGEWSPVASLLSGLSLASLSLPAGDEATVTEDDCEITFGIPIGATGATGGVGATGGAGTQAAYDIPETINEDNLCKAAYYMARQYADDFQDKIQVMKTAISLAQNSIKAGLEALDNIAFWLQDAAVVVDILIGENLIEGLDYLNEQLLDADAVYLAAEQFYCAMKDTYSADPPFAELFGEIDYPLDFPFPNVSLDEAGNWVWSNIEQLTDFVLGLGTGASAGWGIIAWAHIHNELMPEFVAGIFISNPYEALIKLVLNNSEVFAVENCLGFDCFEWEHVWDFTIEQGDWHNRATDLGEYVASLGWRSQDVGHSGTDPVLKAEVLSLEILFDEAHITYIKIEGSAVGGASVAYRGISARSGGSHVFGDLALVNSVEQEVYEDVVTGGADVDKIWLNLDSDGVALSSGHSLITKVTVRGTAFNPFD